MKIVGIMGAMPEEVELICTALNDVTQEEYAGVTYHCGNLHTIRVVVACGGMGKANAASTTQVLATRYNAEAILFSGIAGNMTNKMHIGDVAISHELLYHDAEDRMLEQSAPGTALYRACTTLIQAACDACSFAGVPFLVGRIATGDQFVGDPVLKKKIKDRFHPLCVEMEGAAVAQISLRNKLPFVVIRAISDNSDESIDALGGMEFDISEYTKTASAIVLRMVYLLAHKTD